MQVLVSVLKSGQVGKTVKKKIKCPPTLENLQFQKIPLHPLEMRGSGVSNSRIFVL